MPVDRSEHAFLPPTDHVARALLKRGAREDALALLRAAVARDPGERACAALLRAIEARPDASVYGPDLEVDLGIVEAYSRRGMLLEALALLRGAGLADSPQGYRRRMVLEELLDPCEDRHDQELLQVDHEIRTGGAAVALTLLSDRIARGASLPRQARRRHELLSELLIEGAEEALPRPRSEHPANRSPFAIALGRHMSRRDVEGALRTAQEHLADNPGDVEALAVAEALGRLTAAMKKASADRSGAATFSTQPMTGHTVALFQLRMGNLAEAEQFFRKLVLQEPMDALARSRLEDVQTVRRAIDGVEEPSLASADIEPPTLRRQPEEINPLAQTGLSMPSLSHVPESGGRDEPPLVPTVEVKLDEVTRRVDLSEYDPEREVRVRKPSSPQLLKKHQLRVSPNEGWAKGTAADDWEDEPSTEVARPEDNAELLLQKGFADRALEIYDTLVRSYPNDPRYRARRDEIRGLMATSEDPTTAIDTALPDYRDWEDEEETTMSRSAKDFARPLEEPPTEEIADEDGPTRVHSGKIVVEAREERPSHVRIHRIITIS